MFCRVERANPNWSYFWVVVISLSTMPLFYLSHLTSSTKYVVSYQEVNLDYVHTFIPIHTHSFSKCDRNTLREFWLIVFHRRDSIQRKIHSHGTSTLLGRVKRVIAP